MSHLTLTRDPTLNWRNAWACNAPLWLAPAKIIALKKIQEMAKKVFDGLAMRSVVQPQMVRNSATVEICVALGVVPAGGTSDRKIYVFPDRIADDSDAEVEFIELLHIGLSETVG